MQFPIRLFRERIKLTRTSERYPAIQISELAHGRSPLATLVGLDQHILCCFRLFVSSLPIRLHPSVTYRGILVCRTEEEQCLSILVEERRKLRRISSLPHMMAEKYTIDGGK